MCVPALALRLYAVQLLFVLVYGFDGVRGCCGDIPETFIWTLSFFVLFGILIAMGSFYAYPEYPLREYGEHNECVQVRICDKDIQRIVDAVVEAEREH
jgi:hypothetical protein